MESVKVEYRDSIYYVCEYTNKNDKKLFITDKQSGKKIFSISKNWREEKNHIICRKTVEGIPTRYFADKIIMKEIIDECYDEDEDEDGHYVVEYINGNFKDMRISNLRVVEYGVHMESTNKNIERNMPDDIDIDDVPKCIRYNMQKGGFEINFTHNSEKYYIPLTRVKELSNKSKLVDAKIKLIKFAEEHPDIAKEKHLLENYSKKSIRLMKEYNKIISLSEFDSVEDNLIDIPDREIVTVTLDDLCKKDKIILKNMENTDGTHQRCTTILPKKSKVNVSDLPLYCHYSKASGSHGEFFYIQHHPKLKNGKRLNTSKKAPEKMSLDEKYDQLMNMLNELNS